MANERGSEVKAGGMTTKQKAIIGALVVIVLIIVWQVMGLFGDSPKPTPPVITEKPATHMSTAVPGTPGAPSPGSASTMPSQPPGPRPVQAPQISIDGGDAGPLRQAPVTLENKMLEAQKSSEEKYVDQLNQLQLLKVQREIAEMNQAIASARLATVTAEKSVSDLLTKPSQPSTPVETAPPIPPGAYSNALVNPALEGAQVVGQQPPPPPVPTEVSYVVISVSMQLGKWNAVIGYQGKLYNVSIGDVLPEDNSIVTSINKNGVTLLNKQGKRRKVSLLTSI